MQTFTVNNKVTQQASCPFRAFQQTSMRSYVDARRPKYRRLRQPFGIKNPHHTLSMFFIAGSLAGDALRKRTAVQHVPPVHTTGATPYGDP